MGLLVMVIRYSCLLAAMVAALSLTACKTEPSPQKLPEISFANRGPIRMDVGQLEIQSEYSSPGRSPNVEHLMLISPEAATIRWAQDRLRPTGRSGFARLQIKDAHVTETVLKTDKSFTGMFKEEQGTRYDGALDVAVQILDDRHFTVSEVVARANRSKTVAEDASLAEKDRVLYDITESLVRDIDAQLDGLIRSYMSRYVN